MANIFLFWELRNKSCWGKYQCSIHYMFSEYVLLTGVEFLDPFLIKTMGLCWSILTFLILFYNWKDMLLSQKITVRIHFGYGIRPLPICFLSEPISHRFINAIRCAYKLTRFSQWSTSKIILVIYNWWEHLKQEEEIVPWRQKLSKCNERWHWNN